MALIRGVNCLCPCPRCLVPRDQLSDLTSEPHEARTQAGTSIILREAEEMPTRKEASEHLKRYGLRNVDVRLHVILSYY